MSFAGTRIGFTVNRVSTPLRWTEIGALTGEMKEIPFVVLKRMVVVYDKNALGVFVDAIDDQVVAGGNAMVAKSLKKRVFAKGEFRWYGLKIA